MSPPYSTDPPLDQAQPSGLGTVEDRSPDNLIDEFARSPRGDLHAMAAVLRIEQENAQGFDKGSANQEASPGLPVPSPDISTSAYADDGWTPDFEPSLASVGGSLPRGAAGDAVAASRCGKAIIKVMRKAFLTKERKARARPLKRAARARAIHSHTAHGGARKAGDDGDGDGEPPRRRRKPKPKRCGPRRVETGWCRFYQFPSHMGRKIAPGQCNYASSAALQVAVIGPKYDRQSGTVRTVRSVSSGKSTTVVLGERVETHARIPISFYKFKRKARQ